MSINVNSLQINFPCIVSICGNNSLWLGFYMLKNCLIYKLFWVRSNCVVDKSLEGIRGNFIHSPPIFHKRHNQGHKFATQKKECHKLNYNSWLSDSHLRFATHRQLHCNMCNTKAKQSYVQSGCIMYNGHNLIYSTRQRDKWNPITWTLSSWRLSVMSPFL